MFGWLRKGLLLLGTVLLCGVVAWVIARDSTPIAELQEQARIAFEKHEYEKALTLSRRILEKRPHDADTLLLAGFSSKEMGHDDKAISFWNEVPRDATEGYVEARIATGKLLLFDKFHLSQAMKRFHEVLEVSSDNVSANDHLAFIYGLSGQSDLQLPHRLRLIRQRRFEPMHLVSIALGDESLENAELIESYHRADPNDPLPYITLGRVASEKQDFQAAQFHYEAALKGNRNLMAAQMRLGKLHAEQKDWPAFLNWHAQLPSNADKQSGIWILRGDYALEHLEAKQAAHCYAEAIRLDPNHSHSNYQLGQILISLEQLDEAAPFLERAKTLRKYLNVVKAASFNQNLTKVQEAAALAESLGLLYEAFAWSLVLEQHAPPGDPTQIEGSHIRSKLESLLGSLPLERCDPNQNPIRLLDVDEFPRPTFPSALDDPTTTGPADWGDARIAFEDQAEETGLTFRYFNGRENVEDGLQKMYEFAGGGVAIFDYDGDSLPDIFFTQGCPWPPGSPSLSRKFNDRLFRNLGDGTFADVTLAAGLQESDFGQGVSVGDFDSDGWPDLFVANIGQNRFYRNNTDGTFREISEPAGIRGSRWSTSAALVDLNGDRHPDLYVVNYLGDEDIFTRVCGSLNDPGICLPQSFTAEQDRLYLNLGDGRFQDVTESAGIQLEDGKGLGIVAADFDGSGELGLFVANDTTPNFLFQASSKPNSDHWSLAESGLLRGLAFNREGKTESGMGVAVGDANQDGRLDLFVTNFFGESNTLYQQLPSGIFEDVSLKVGLHQPSLPLVGFGTQFLDANLDGWQDLIVTNGHIDDFRKLQQPYYQMPPQFFGNRGGRFSLVKADSLGSYFQKRQLGRALAKGDWNRDGREDVVITHLDGPAALLTNTTTDPGNGVVLQFRGTESPRDAIGTIVKATCNGRTLTRQLTAGDGYFCSNERQVLFGLGDATQLDGLVVTWPSGRREEFPAVPAGSRLVLVEGRGILFSLPQNWQR